MGKNQPADDRESKRAAGLGAGAHSECDPQRAHQCGHRGHHNGPEPNDARAVDGLGRGQRLVALGFDGEVDHHNAVLFHQHDEHDDADESVQVEVDVERLESEQRAEPPVNGRAVRIVTG